MIDDIITGIPLGFFLSFMIGPVFFVLLETSVTKGFRAAMTFDLGVILGDVVFISIAYFSSYRLIQSLKDEPALFLFGGIIMLTYGVMTFMRLTKAGKNPIDKIEVEIVKKNYFSLFIKGFLLNFINIGVLGFWLAIILTFGPKLDMEPSRMLVFFAAVLATYFLTDVGKVLLAKQLKSKLTISNINKIKKSISIVLIVFGLILIFQGYFPGEKKLVNDALHKIEKKN
ncbi:LysE family translocator [Flavobacterium kingsejongi]|uniref:Lysine transporter LysE n=1 Tax=Flavobacterium kingsejongi TaxID=1678728 RepID=A0A2S1LLF5_9FLAO|nr:LysE family transporter [Flavobacterium kingsejongi]AWG24548.1 lysine transporter LysE [Flavobacterium kingsejongi]